MKAKPAKLAKANISASKSKPMAKKAVKPVVSKQVAKKTAPKPTSKPVGKPKPTSKASVKPLVKKASQPSGKVKPASKAKPVVKNSTVKPVVKAPTVQVKTTAKAVAKPMPKAAAKVAPKAVPKVAAKPVHKSVNKPVVNPAPAASTKKIAPLPALQPAAVQLKPTMASNGLPPPPPLKPGRRSSSRALAHMPPPAPMVPTHAPDAAKASYSTMTERVIAPPPHVAAKKDPKLANNWKTKTAQDLTDEEVKAMPDAEYMNDKQMAFFRHRLSILKQDIHNSAGATTEHLREDTTVVPDPADRATIEEEHALELRTRDRERKLLKKIEQSIARIDSGDYGYCDETGEPIGVGRLIARPTASLSLEAQQRRELKQKMFGD